MKFKYIVYSALLTVVALGTSSCEDFLSKNPDNRVELPGAEEPEITGYYSLDGRAYDSPRKGLNIVRYSDGSARKIIVP